MVVQPRETAAQQRLHDHGRNAALFQLAVQVVGIDVAAPGMLPIDVVHLYLHEVPHGLAPVMHRQQMVEDLPVAVERPPEVADAPRLAFAQEKVEHAVVDEPFVEGLHAFAAAHRVQQVVVQIIDLQFGHRPAVHGQRIFACEIREIGHLRGDEHLLARMAFEGDARGFFGKALHVDGRRIEIVDPVGNGIID